MKLNNSTTITLIVLLVAGLLAALYFFYIRPYSPKYKWTASYYYNDDQPYGTDILYKSLEASHKKANFNLINKSFEKQFDWKGTNNCYIFIGNNYRLTEAESMSLFSFIEKGNVAFICTEDLTYSVIQKFFPEKEEESDFKTEETYEPTETNNVIESYDTIIYNNKNGIYDTIIYSTNNNIVNDEDDEYFINFDTLRKKVEVHFFDSLQTKQTYSFHHQFLKDTTEYNFALFNPELLDHENYTYKTISYFDSIHNINCISIKYGKGEVYLHANPILFTNYFLSTTKGYNHANTVLSFVGNKTIYWDEVNKMRDFNRDENFYNYSGEQSPFRYLLSQKSFRWAWYLLLTSLALFFIFSSKRRQKAIPLIDTDKNSSLAYIKAVATLYYQPRSHSAIAEEIWHLFCVFVKTKYGIDLKHDEKEQMETLSKASKVDLQIIEGIIKYKNDIIYLFDGNKNSQLKMLQQLIEEFYKKTK